MSRIPQYDDKNRLYYPITLIDTEGRFTINGISYAVDVDNIENFSVFKRPNVYVELEHPARLPTMSDEDYRRRNVSIETQNVVGTVDVTILRPSRSRVVVTGNFYPGNLKPEIREAFERGDLSLGVRARVTTDRLVDIITWDLVFLPERELRHVECERPPLNTTVFVSSNRGYTWFPAMFLWIGEKTFVWRNMVGGAQADNEITNNNRFTYFMWSPVPEGVELKTYSGNDVPDFLRKRSDANAN